MNNIDFEFVFVMKNGEIVIISENELSTSIHLYIFTFKPTV